jgi:type VI secretion system secreted protein VgrG
MPATQQNRLIAIATTLGKDKPVLKSFSMTEQLGRLFRGDAELISDDPALDFDKLVGSSATVSLQLQNGKTRFFNGFISRFSQTGEMGNFARYRAELVPWLWFLTRTSDCRIFQKKKVPDIIEEVFKAHGFRDYKLRLTGKHPEWEYCVQYRETDFNFVSRLMEQEGISYFFEHANGVHTMILADAPTAYEAYPDHEEFIYRTATHQGRDATESVTHWVIEKELKPVVYALSDFNFKNPTPIVVNSNVTRHHEAAHFEIYDHPGEFDDRAEGEMYAKLRIQELQAQHQVLRGQATIRAVSTGCKFDLKHHPRNDQNIKYLITGTSIQIQAEEFQTSGGSSARDFFACSFTAIPADQAFRTPRTTPKPLIQGPQTAIVVGKGGEEIDTDEFGRVKVQFHWDRYGKVDENSSCWVRVSQPTAGKGWGFITVPRIGQEVVVEFLEGDPDLPIITGRVYNATNKVPYTLGDFKTISGFKSNSSKGGNGFNEIRFEDKKGEEQIFIHGQKNMDIRVTESSYEYVGKEQHLIVKENKFDQIEKDRDETVNGDHKETIGKDRHLKVTGKEAKAVDGSLSLTVKGDVAEVFKANHGEDTSGQYFVRAKDVIIEGASSVTIKCGGTSIAMDATGIKVVGTMVEIEGQGTLEAKSPMTTVKGDGMLTLKGGITAIN